MKKLIFVILALATVMATIFNPIAGVASMAVLPFLGKAKVSIEDMKNFAGHNFSSFEGERYNFGAEDQSLDFGGNATSFIDEQNSNRIFVMNITNSTSGAEAADLEAYILPGSTYVPGMVGAPKTGAFKSIANTDGLSGSGSPQSIELFYAFIMRNPTNVGKLKIETSSKTAQLNQIILVEEMTPFANAEGKPINLNNSQTESTYRDKIVTVPTPWLIASDQVRAKMLFLAGETVSITWYMGAVQNQSVELKKKVTTAHSVANQLGGGFLSSVKRLS